MIIKLTAEISYNTDLMFEKQTAECIAFVNDFIANNTPEYVWDETNRPSTARYSSKGWNIIKTSIWNTPSPSCGLEKEVLTVEEIGGQI
jgi:hypothetical protein